MKRQGFTLPEVLIAMMLLGSALLAISKMSGTALRQAGNARRLLRHLPIIKRRITDIASFNREQAKEKMEDDLYELEITKTAIDEKKSELKEIKSVQFITVKGTWPNKETVQLTKLVYREPDEE